MSNSTQEVVSDGTLASIAITFPYFDRADIHVHFDGVEDALPWSWSGPTSATILFSPPVPFGVKVLVKRTTNVNEVRHVFTGGAKFDFQTLDENYQQILQVAQEFQEGAVITDLYNDLDMHGHRIVNALASGGEGFIFQGDWQPSTPYQLNNIVYINDGGIYDGYSMICTAVHTSGTLFADDFIDYWEVLTKRGASGSGSGDLVSTANLNDVANPATALSNLNGMPKTGGVFTGAVSVPFDPFGPTWFTSPTVTTKRDVYNFTATFTDAAISTRKASSSIVIGGTDDVLYLTTARTRQAIDLYGTPPGTLIPFAGNTAPTGYVLCPTVQTIVNIADYPRLAAAIGNLWGGNGTTTFGLPYFPAGEVPVQAGTNTVGDHTNGKTPDLNANLAAGSVSTAVYTGTYNTNNPSNKPGGSYVRWCVKI